MTGLVTYFQNAKSEAIVDAFKNFIPPKTKVLRAGNYTTIDAAKVTFSQYYLSHHFPQSSSRVTLLN